MDDPLVLLAQVRARVVGDSFWEPYLAQATAGLLPCGLHLGVFVEPFLQYVLDGLKTVESRFSAHRCAPYRQVQAGDVLLLKRSGGGIVGLAQITYTWFYHLDPTSWQTIRTDFTQALCAQDPQFWQDRIHTSFATLMRIQHVCPFAPIPFSKRDRRGWVVLQPAVVQLELPTL
jgi:hypothetical protein